MSESASSSYVYREAVEEEGESASSQYAISAIQGADWNISEEQQGQGQAEEGDYYYNGGDGYEEGRLTANGEDYWNSPEGQAAAAAYYQQYYSYSSSMEEHERESGAGEANNSQQRMTTVPGYSSTTTTTTTTIPSMASTAKTSISAAAKATSSFASSSAAAVVASNDGGVPYPAGYTPSASHSVSIVMKQQHSHLNSSQISSLNAPSVSSAPTTTTPTTSSSSSTSTYYTPAQPNYSSLAAHPYDPQNTSSSSSTTSKRKKTIRTAGGEVWQDDTLDEWDQNDYRLFCGDLGNEVSDEMLTRAFDKYPSFRRAKVIRDKRTFKSKGFGFVSFLDPNDFVKALREVNGKYVGNRPIKLRKSTWDERNVELRLLKKIVGAPKEMSGEAVASQLMHKAIKYTKKK